MPEPEPPQADHPGWNPETPVEPNASQVGPTPAPLASAGAPLPAPASEPGDAAARWSAPRHPHPRRLPAVVVVLLLGLVGGWLLGRQGEFGAASAPAYASGNLARSIQLAARRVAPAVVKIEVSSVSHRRRRMFALPPGMNAPPAGVPQVEHSLGSGLILDARGYIITNRHVVHNASRIAVTVPGDQHVYFARLLGADSATDLALIKIDAPRPLPVAPLGDSRRLAVGEWVVAIGSPFGLDNSVTAGIVSALHRAIDPAQQFETFIQTDAPINPGNSGGPLLDLSGQVVGINTAIYSDTDSYQGVGFALPMALVNQIYPQLLRRGQVIRGSIGVYFETAMSPAVQRVYHLPAGVAISEVAKPGPAATAGLQPGDVITGVNGAAVASGEALSHAIVGIPIGQRVEISFERNGVAHRAGIRVANRDLLYPDEATANEAEAPAARAPEQPDWGMHLKALPAAGGLEVERVTPDSFADQIGVRRDDVVLEINHQRVHGAADVARIVASIHPDQDVAMVLRRPNGDGTVSRWMLGGTLPPPPLVAVHASAGSERR
ncbi:MAG: trypsin-like peptidase domain-containing protein [Terriglobales bacterium]